MRFYSVRNFNYLSVNKKLTHHFTFITVVVPYEVTFYTGDVNKAGTDANVKLTVFGDGGSSTEQVRDQLIKLSLLVSFTVQQSPAPGLVFKAKSRQGEQNCARTLLARTCFTQLFMPSL